MTNFEQEDGTYSCILDKGTLDALMSDQSEETCQMAFKYFSVINSSMYCVKIIIEYSIPKALLMASALSSISIFPSINIKKINQFF